MSNLIRPWEDRVIEEANLFNPAFCSTALARAVDAYTSKTNKSFPYALAFMVLPIILHKHTRENLPISIVTSMHSWLTEHPEALVNYSKRVQRLSKYTKEALLFSLQHKQLQLEVDGGLKPGKYKPAASLVKKEWMTTEVIHCLEKAQFIGRWFAAAGTINTIMSSWSIKP